MSVYSTKLSIILTDKNLDFFFFHSQNQCRCKRRPGVPTGGGRGLVPIKVEPVLNWRQTEP